MLDIHNHILYSVDDGVETLEESLQILQTYKNMGINYIILTPHLNHPTVKSDIHTIQNHYNLLIEASLDMKVKLFLGSELYLTPRIKEYIPILDRFLLIELDTLTYPLYLFDKIFDLQLDGYEIILAHAERYQWLRENQNVCKKLKEMNVYFQVNVNNFKEGEWLLKEGYVEFLATDYHGLKRSGINWDAFKKYENLIKHSMKLLGVEKL